MGTLVALSVDAPSEVIAAEALEAAWEAILLVELRMHPRHDGSDLAALHAAPVGTAVAVHAWTHELLRLSLELNRDSGGVFDPCLPDAPGRLDGLELLGDWRLRRRVDLRLDLGGIAKGFAVDRAIDALRLAGCTSALVNAGGDLRVFGARSEFVQVGRHGRRSLQLEAAALAVSEPSDVAPAEHRGYYCRAPGRAQVAASAAVMAPTAAVADALTKCAVFLPPGECAALLERWRAQLL